MLKWCLAMLTVHLRINDSLTAQPTPVRLRISAADGAHFAPLGHAVEFATGRNEDVGGHLKLGSERWFAIDGACEIRLPANVPLRIQALHGPEFRPLDQTVTLGPGQMAIRFAMERWSDLAADSWLAGDTRSHFLTPHAAALEGAAEALAFVNLLAMTQPLPCLDGTAYTTVPNLVAFSGQIPALEKHDCTVTVNTFNVHPMLGRVGLLHSHRPVHPLTFGGADDTDDWSVNDWCDQCHRKQGLTMWVDAFRGDRGLVGGEALAALVLGKLDAIEVDAQPRTQPLLPWVYRLWNAGLPVPLVGGSGKDSNRVALGAMRTFAQIAENDASRAVRWIEAVRAGRTFVTNGPILTFSAGGHGPGTTLDFPTQEGPVDVRVTARSPVKFEKLELVADGRVLASASPFQTHGLYEAKLSLPQSPTGGGWLAARCWGHVGAMLDPASSTFAHTSPVWFRPRGGAIPVRMDAIPPIRRAITESREWVEHHGRFASEKLKHQLLGHHDRALARLPGEPGAVKEQNGCPGAPANPGA